MATGGGRAEEKKPAMCRSFNCQLQAFSFGACGSNQHQREEIVPGGLQLWSSSCSGVLAFCAPLTVMQNLKPLLKLCLFCEEQNLEIVPKTSFSCLPIMLKWCTVKSKAFSGVLTHCCFMCWNRSRQQLQISSFCNRCMCTNLTLMHFTVCWYILNTLIKNIY